MKKYYNKELPVTVHVTYGGRQSGKTYREFKKLEEENVMLRAAWDDMVHRWESLVKRIGKAIEYTEQIDDWDIKDFRRKELLKILRGEENEKLKFSMQDTYDSANDTCGELQQRIDKAIEYMRNKSVIVKVEKKDFELDLYLKEFEYNELLKILKGEENESN